MYLPLFASESALSLVAGQDDNISLVNVAAAAAETALGSTTASSDRQLGQAATMGGWTVPPTTADLVDDLLGDPALDVSAALADSQVGSTLRVDSDCALLFPFVCPPPLPPPPFPFSVSHEWYSCIQLTVTDVLSFFFSPGRRPRSYSVLTKRGRRDWTRWWPRRGMRWPRWPLA